MELTKEQWHFVLIELCGEKGEKAMDMAHWGLVDFIIWLVEQRQAAPE